MKLLNNSLLKKLKEYDETKTAFHMPGHMRNKEVFNDLSEFIKMDITEIDGFDDLHHPKEILKESMDIAKNLWNTKGSFYLVNGSTSGNLSAIYSLTKPKDKILIAKNCHKSIYHAIEVFDLSFEYIYPKYDENLGIFLSIDSDDIEKILERNSDIKLVVITSPTYEGVVSDIEKISKVVHRYGAKLIVDEAHGAGFGLSDNFPKSSIDLGADITVQSLHKTLASFTQTAILHIADESLYPKLRKSLEIFQTSSPSYILMSSIDYCVRMLEKDRKTLFKNWRENLEYFYEKCRDLKNIKLLSNINLKNIFELDNSKITILTNNTNISGYELMKTLRTEYDIELEMASFNYAIAYTGIGVSKKSLDKLAFALFDIDKSLYYENCKKIALNNLNLIRKFSIKESTIFESEEFDIENSVSKISSEYVWAYPPGIPILTPGEVITEEILNLFQKYRDENIDLRFSKSNDNDKINIIYKK